MKAKSKYQSDALGAVHETASDLHAAGLMDGEALREFDEMCLTQESPIKPEAIREILRREHISRSELAMHLNVPEDTVYQWERGEKRPEGPSLVLLRVVHRKGLDAIAHGA